MAVGDLISTFRHELVSTVLVTAFLGALMYPFKKIAAAYKETQETLKGINTQSWPSSAAIALQRFKPKAMLR